MSQDSRKSEAITSALQRQYGADTEAQVEGHNVFVKFPGAEVVERFALSVASWEILEAAIERGVPLEPDSELALIAPEQDAD